MVTFRRGVKSKLQYASLVSESNVSKVKRRNGKAKNKKKFRGDSKVPLFTEENTWS
jgi:hypothetical protein